MAKRGGLAATRAKQKAAKLLSKREFPAARAAYQKVCELSPEDSGAWLALGEISGALGDIQGAENAYQQALSFNRDLPQAHSNLGRMAARRGQWPVAEEHQRAVLDLQPNDLRTYLELGVTLEGQGKKQEAEQVYRRALSMDDSRAELHVALGRVLREQGKFAEIKPLIQRALQILPDMALAHLEKGHLLRREKKYQAALEAYQHFAKLVPQERLGILSICAGVLGEMERAEEALSCCDQLVKEFPQSADVHLVRAMQLLLMERFEEGWREYEWRRASNEWRNGDTEYSSLQPLWQGEPLQGKTVLVYVEQGFGDTLQFCRYLPKLAEQGATVHFHCQPELYGLLSSLEGVAELEIRDFSKAVQGKFDYYVPLMSLPYLFDTNADTIPAETPYLYPEAERKAYWQQRLAHDGFKIGLVWAGSGGHLKDKRRSLDLKELAPLAGLENVTWYSLQKGSAETQLADENTVLEITNLSADINDFSDTAAIIANLDLVISVDTSVAHLAGALGCPAWVMLFNGPDWRWQLKREDSPWYPSLRLFRQTPGEAWSAVVTRVAAALKEISARV